MSEELPKPILKGIILNLIDTFSEPTNRLENHQSIIKQIYIELSPDKLNALVGLNGSGKSTLLRAIQSLMLYADEGVRNDDFSLFSEHIHPGGFLFEIPGIANVERKFDSNIEECWYPAANDLPICQNDFNLLLNNGEFSEIGVRIFPQGSHLPSSKYLSDFSLKKNYEKDVNGKYISLPVDANENSIAFMRLCETEKDLQNEFSIRTRHFLAVPDFRLIENNGELKPWEWIQSGWNIHPVMEKSHCQSLSSFLEALEHYENLAGYSYYETLFTNSFNAESFKFVAGRNNYEYWLEEFKFGFDKDNHKWVVGRPIARVGAIVEVVTSESVIDNNFGFKLMETLLSYGDEIVDLNAWEFSRELILEPFSGNRRHTLERLLPPPVITDKDFEEKRKDAFRRIKLLLAGYESLERKSIKELSNTLSLGESRIAGFTLEYLKNTILQSPRERPPFRVALFDEPELGLSQPNIVKLIDICELLAKHIGTILFATHSPTILQQCDLSHEILLSSPNPAIRVSHSDRQQLQRIGVSYIDQLKFKKLWILVEGDADKFVIETILTKSNFGVFEMSRSPIELIEVLPIRGVKQLPNIPAIEIIIERTNAPLLVIIDAPTADTTRFISAFNRLNKIWKSGVTSLNWDLFDRELQELNKLEKTNEVVGLSELFSKLRKSDLRIQSRIHFELVPKAGIEFAFPPSAWGIDIYGDQWPSNAHKGYLAKRLGFDVDPGSLNSWVASRVKLVASDTSEVPAVFNGILETISKIFNP